MSWKDAKIKNIVATTILSKELDLEQIASTIVDTKYKKDHFPGLIIHIDIPKTTYLLFGNGMAVSLGAHSIKDVSRGMHQLRQKLIESGFSVSISSDIIIRNIVTSFSLSEALNLKDTALSLGLENIEYEPEQFPGLIYRLDNPHAVFLIFNSGKAICLGTTSTEQTTKAIGVLSSKLRTMKQV
jgi:transcription initiation factor TFIID TATA-box-binding protein